MTSGTVAPGPDNHPMRLPPFRIEEYYGKYEFTTRYMLSSSDCESRTIGDLLALEPGAHDDLLAHWCGYTESQGAPWLREAVAALYERIDPADVLIVDSAEEGIFLAYHALLGPEDHAVVETPCYQSALDLARSTGAAVSEWRRGYGDGWALHLDELERLVRPNTRLLYLNEPHNPTGTLMDRATYGQVAELADAHGILLFNDEVYRELEHEPARRLPAACDVGRQAISLGSMSKTYGLPGLRLGWLVTREPRLREAMLGLRLYTTICSSAPSEYLTALALRNRDVLVQRNLGIVRDNLRRLDAFFERRSDLFEWVRPNAGPIGFPRLRPDLDVDAFCEHLATTAGVLLLPGSVYDQLRHVRVGFGRANMAEALERLDRHLETVDGSLRPD